MAVLPILLGMALAPLAAPQAVGRRPVLLRYRWKEGREFHYDVRTAGLQNGKRFVSGRLLDVSVLTAKGGKASVFVHVGCRGNLCVPKYFTFDVDALGAVPSDADSADFPLVRLPAAPVLPGATWQARQVYGSGRLVLQSHCRFDGVKKVDGRMVAEIEDKFTLLVGKRRTGGTRSVLLDLADGMVRGSEIHGEAEVLWKRI